MLDSKTIQEENNILEEIDFGKVITDLLDTPTITDIKIWNKEIIVVDRKKGEYKFEYEGYTPEQIEEAKSIAYELPRKVAIRMRVNYNKGQAILDGEMKYKNNVILRFNAINDVLVYGETPALAIRKTNFEISVKDDDMFTGEYADETCMELLLKTVNNRGNVVIGGGTGSGKTTLLRYLAVNGIKNNESVITIEDTFEAFLKEIKPKMKVLALKSNENYSFSDLLKTSLRQEPQWILVSEVRDEAVINMLAASGSGHAIITTVHASNAKIIPWRLVDMSKAVGTDAERIFRQAHQNIDLGVYIDYYNDKRGSHRRIIEICEFYLDDNGQPKEHTVYKYNIAENKYIAEKIESPELIRKLTMRNADLRKLKEAGLL